MLVKILKPDSTDLQSDPIEQLVREVLMEEGYFKQTSEPISFTSSDGIKWYYIDFEELGKPLN